MFKMNLPPFLSTLLCFYKGFASKKGDQLIVVTHYMLVQRGYKVLENNQVKIRLCHAKTVTLFQIHEHINLNRTSESLFMNYIKDAVQVKVNHDIKAGFYSFYFQVSSS